MQNFAEKDIRVVLVDKNDKVLGYKKKHEAHKNPVPLHRAISVIIFDKNREKMLLQKRATGKPTWPLFWTNATCTHPYPDESYKKAAERRLEEEMGFTVPLKEVFKFIYKARYNETWGEHEYDVCFIGFYTGRIESKPEEVAEYKWMDINELKEDVRKNKEKYTPWFKIIMEKLEKITWREVAP